MTPNMQFLINCCKYKPATNDIEKIRTHIAQLNNNQQLSKITTLAHAHGIFPLVYHAIQEHAADLLSNDTLDDLKQENLTIVMQNMRMTAELIRIMRLLEENGIGALAFKGPALAQLAYGDITLRQYGDLDILIRKKDIAKTIALLTKDEYIPEIHLPEATQKMFFACVNVIGLEKTTRIEIHWELVSKNYAINWEESELWIASNTININGTLIPMLSYNTHLLYLCAHGSKHLFERLEWVSDIDRFIRENPALAWQSLFEDAQSKGIERMLLLGLFLCHKLLATPLPENISTRVVSDPAVAKLGNHIIKLHFSTSNTSGKSYGTFRLLYQMREKLADQLSFTYRGIFAPTLEDFKYIKLPRSLIFMYSIIRPFRLLMKYLPN